MVLSRILKNMNLDHMLFIIFKSDSLNLNHSLRLSLTITLFYLLTIILCWTPLQCSLYLWHLFWHLFWGLFLKTSPHTQTQMSSEQSFKWKGKKMIKESMTYYSWIDQTYIFAVLLNSKCSYDATILVHCG